MQESDIVSSGEILTQEAQTDDAENDSGEMTFEDLGLDEKILSAIAKKGFKVRIF